MRPTNEPDPSDEENRQDFNILQRHQLSWSSSSSSTQAPSTLISNSSSSGSATAELWPLKLNTQFIDHYMFGDTIGSGSYADVRECIDTRTLERCAVKIIDKHYLRRQNPAALLNQKQEIRLLRQLSHQNIIAMRECLSMGPKIYIFLEHCTFVLSNLLNEQPDNRLCTSVARNLFQQLIWGLNYLHSNGIIHRDLKPQNLLLTTRGTLKIIDFGVSQILSIWSQQDRCSNYEGSPLFQAPEVVSGQLEYAGYKVDVWSAGITLYLMLFGQYPFIDDSLLGLYDKILGSEFREVPDGTCPVVEDLLTMLLNKISSARPTTELILDHPWLKFKDLTNGDENYDPHSEFIELTQLNHRQSTETNSSLNQQQPSRADIYRSMSVLPYLHNFHFPHLITMKARQQQQQQQQEETGGRAREEAELSDTTSTSAASSSSSASSATSVSQSALSSRPGSPSRSPTQQAATTTTAAADDDDATQANNPHEMIADQPVEWGTEGQYNLMKVPLIRANRLRQEPRQSGRGRRRTRPPRAGRRHFRSC